MPFTFAHPTIVLPLSYVPKRWVSVTGLIIGSMVPDFEYFIRLRVKSIYSHTWAGLFWFDIPLGLMLTLLYSILIKDKLIDHLPEKLNRRFSKFKGILPSYYSFYYVIIICISVLIGTATHLVWDSFTHPTGYFVNIIPILSATINIDAHQLYVYKLIQHSSTIIGLGIIGLTIFSLAPGEKTKFDDISGYWLKIILTGIAVLVTRLLTGMAFHEYGNLIVTIIAGCQLGLIITSISTNKKKA
jgi:hypothetical protein